MNRNVVVAALGTAQTLARASSYYLPAPAILAEPMAEGTGVSRTIVFGVFSGALLLSAFFGPAVGRAIDQHGGRGVLAISNIVFAAGLALRSNDFALVGERSHGRDHEASRNPRQVGGEIYGDCISEILLFWIVR